MEEKRKISLQYSDVLVLAKCEDRVKKLGHAVGQGQSTMNKSNKADIAS